MFEKQDEKWNELSAKTNIVMKRGPILLNGQERELVLLSHGFVLAQVQEDSGKNAFARLMIARTYEQCELYDAIEYVRSVPVTENVIIEVEEEEDNEEKGVEVEVNAGETVVVRRRRRKKKNLLRNKMKSLPFASGTWPRVPAVVSRTKIVAVQVVMKVLKRMLSRKRMIATTMRV